MSTCQEYVKPYGGTLRRCMQVRPCPEHDKPPPDPAKELAKVEAALARKPTTLPVYSNARKDVPLYRGPLRYFPAALADVARLCKSGNDKHNPGEEMHHARGKSNDHADCIMRHLLDMSEDFGAGVGRDENGVAQVTMIAWRALALAQEWHEAHGAPLAPGARVKP